MRTDELDYHLPEDLIAVRPAHPRDAARLLVVRRDRPGEYEHRIVRDLPELLGAKDRLVVNRSRVLPARLVGVNVETGGRIEGLFLEERAPAGPERDRATWSVMLKARRHRTGARLQLILPDGSPSDVTLELLGRDPDAEAAWLVDVHLDVEAITGVPCERSVLTILERVGRTPIPPYIRQARKAGGINIDDTEDRDEYQTVYASDGGGAGSEPAAGSVAAPTAGLHFTGELLERLASGGVMRSEVELHVGAGTFRPIETDSLTEHQMHAEWCSLGTSKAWLAERLEGHATSGSVPRVIAVGTTTARTLESFAHAPQPWPAWMNTDLFIAPGHRWLGLDAMLTNFHLPRSSLLAMVGAFLPGGVAELLDAYREAIGSGYRFYSYGDAMLIL
jgi:S-adenosylmethionine:tRNA ribosyltransferase-isomerase